MSSPLTWLTGRYRVRLLLRAAGRAREVARYALVRPRHRHHFHIASTQRNAGCDILRCLDSVYGQRYPKDGFRHLVIDDASTDDTRALIEEWCEQHPGHTVELVQRSQQRGGTRNTLDGIRKAGSQSIVIELNGDDWLPDPGVLSFLNKVYQDPEVWMTYNTQRESTGVIPFQLPPPRAIREKRAFRDHPWATSHLHSFRRRLFDHVPEEVMIDPETGEFWQSADDVALYLWMLELAGDHARHLWRITYFYNFHDQTEYRLDRDGQLARERRIRNFTKAEALDAL
jgi:glycosyltransferase involved in cell wall biosynthesis